MDPDKIRARIPATWRVDEEPYIEVDQDGRRPPYRFPKVGSVVFRVEPDSSGSGGVKVTQFQRVRCLPGYSETRKIMWQGTGDPDSMLDMIAKKAVDLGEINDDDIDYV